MSTQDEIKSFDAFQDHKGFHQIFGTNKLTFGFVAPMGGYPDGPVPDLSTFDETVRIADEGGVDAIWLRDVPFLDPNFGDAGQVYDPMVYAGYLAATTKRIAIGTAGIVLPLHDPIFVAKQAASVDQLSGGRFLLGLASGDRPIEYPTFGKDFENRVVRFREAREIIREITEKDFPTFQTEFYGSLDGSINLIPKPVLKSIPTLSIGRGGQDLGWIGEKMDGWIWHGENARNVSLRIKQWHEATKGVKKPYGYAHFFNLLEDPNAPVFFSGNYIQGGRNALIEFWKSQEAAGLSHALLNPKPMRRPTNDMMQEFTEYIIPNFK